MPLIENTIFVLSNGMTIKSTPSLSTNTCTFMYIHKCMITTTSALRVQRKMIANKKSQSVQQLQT